MKKKACGCLIRAVLLFILTLSRSTAQEDQKPSFEVAHKAGKMDVTASQFSADVSLKSDTVDVDVKPGDTDVPIQARHQKLLHVYQLPMLGKKSKVPQRAIENKRKLRLKSKHYVQTRGILQHAVNSNKREYVKIWTH